MSMKIRGCVWGLGLTCMTVFGCRAEREADQGHAAELSRELEEARSQLHERGQDVEKLTQLSLDGEATLRDYVNHMQVAH